MALRLPLRPAPQSAWAVVHERLALGTRKPQQFIDITERVLRCVRLSGMSDGTVTVQSRHTTAAILVNENEPLLLDDLSRVLAGWAPAHARYSHDDFERRTANMTPDERPNGHAHARAMALQASTTLAVIGDEVVVTTVGVLARPRERPALRSVLPELVEEPS